MQGSIGPVLTKWFTRRLGLNTQQVLLLRLFFGFPNVPDGTDFNLECKKKKKLEGGGANPQNPVSFLFLTVHQFPPLVDTSYGQGTKGQGPRSPSEEILFSFVCLLLFEATMLIQNINLVKCFF